MLNHARPDKIMLAVCRSQLHVSNGGHAAASHHRTRQAVVRVGNKNAGLILRVCSCTLALHVYVNLNVGVYRVFVCMRLLKECKAAVILVLLCSVWAIFVLCMYVYGQHCL
jgi:hypothetical protein